MDFTSFIIVAILILVVTAFITYVISKMRFTKTITLLESTKLSLQKEKHEVVESKKAVIIELDNERKSRVELEKEKAGLSADLKNLNSLLENTKNDHVSLLEKFENLSSKVLQRQSAQLGEQHQKSMQALLNPLTEKLKTFEEKVEATHKESLEKNATLKEQIRNLTELNEVMSNEAKNLTTALKGDNKASGTWGEIVLERILEKSGLEKDREYFVQKSHNGEMGRQRPDILIQTPDDKYYVIDSKVSLKAYETFTSADDEEEQKRALKAHSRSIRAHIDGLSKKKYEDLYKVKSPDFVFMFVPIDTAFTTALKYDDKLYEHAFDSNIIIVTPSTLLATLKTIDSLWRNEKQTRNAMEIATEASKMLDKFSDFVADLEKVGQRIDQAKNSYDDSMKKLTEGRGNLISKAKKIENLGAKANKQISKEVLRIANEDAA